MSYYRRRRRRYSSHARIVRNGKAFATAKPDASKLLRTAIASVEALLTAAAKDAGRKRADLFPATYTATKTEALRAKSPAARATLATILSDAIKATF